MKKNLIILLVCITTATVVSVIINSLERLPQINERATEYQVYSPLKIYGYLVLNSTTNLPVSPSPMWLINHNDTLKFYGSDNQWHPMGGDVMVGGFPESGQFAIFSAGKTITGDPDLKISNDSTYLPAILNLPGPIWINGSLKIESSETFSQIVSDRDRIIISADTILWLSYNAALLWEGNYLIDVAHQDTLADREYVRTNGGSSVSGGWTASVTETNTPLNVGVGVTPSYAFQVQKSVSADVLALFNNTNAAGYGVVFKNGNDNNYAVSVQNTSGANKIMLFGSGNITSSTITSGGNKFTVSESADSGTIRIFYLDVTQTGIRIDSMSEAGVAITNSDNGYMANDIHGNGYYAENAGVSFYSSSASTYGFVADNSGTYNFYTPGVFGVDDDSTYILYLAHADTNKYFALITPTGGIDTGYLDPMSRGLIDPLIDVIKLLNDTVNGEIEWRYIDNGILIKIHRMPPGLDAVEALQYMVEMILRMQAADQIRFQEIERRLKYLEQQQYRSPPINIWLFLPDLFFLIAIGFIYYLIGRRK